jgi:hypothetical protein
LEPHLATLPYKPSHLRPFQANPTARANRLRYQACWCPEPETLNSRKHCAAGGGKEEAPRGRGVPHPELTSRTQGEGGLQQGKKEGRQGQEEEVGGEEREGGERETVEWWEVHCACGFGLCTDRGVTLGVSHVGFPLRDRSCQGESHLADDSCDYICCFHHVLAWPFSSCGASPSKHTLSKPKRQCEHG